MFNVICLLGLLLNTSAIYGQGLKQEVVVTTGQGVSEKDATQDALVQAVAQVRGLAISSSEMVSLRDTIINEVGTSSTQLKTDISTQTKGVVTKFEVLDSMFSKMTNLYSVKVRATIPVYKASQQLNRLRMAVTSLQISPDIKDRSASSKFAADWMSKLEDGLVQTRRFAMLDRSFADVTAKELAQYTSADYTLGELAKLGQRAGTDYLITGRLLDYRVIDKSVTNPLNGERIARSALSAEVSIRVIDIASGQVKFAKSYTDSSKAVVDIINSIYPLSVLALSLNGVTIGQGGDSIKVGERYRVYALGKELRDPYTNEFIERQAIPVGEIEIIETDSNKIEESPYDPEFVAMVKKAQKSKNRTIVDPNDIWGSLGLK
jgi:hypothetical protein